MCEERELQLGNGSDGTLSRAELPLPYSTGAVQLSTQMRALTLMIQISVPRLVRISLRRSWRAEVSRMQAGVK